MRTLHTNSRNYQEPFLLLITKSITTGIAGVEGVDKWKVADKKLMFGSIMNRALTFANSQQDDTISSLSIKIVYQDISIKPQDRIVVNDNQYVITAIDKDYYNKSVINIKCEYEKVYVKDHFISSLDCVLNAKLVS